MRVPRRVDAITALQRLSRPRLPVVATPLSGPVRVAGYVGSGGEVLAGAGFTAKRTELGFYVVTLTTELAGDGIMVVNAVGGPYYGALGVPGKKEFPVAMVNASGGSVDSAFTFHIEPS